MHKFIQKAGFLKFYRHLEFLGNFKLVGTKKEFFFL
jgi:hypothetical protein